jgi:ankyrin repeat protein
VALDNVDNVRMLLEAGAMVNEEVTTHKYSPLMLAAMRGNRTLMRMLIEVGADVNARDAQGNSVLMWAAYGSETGDVRIADLLLAAGADPSVRNRTGESAVTWAKRHGATPMVAFLKNAAQTE